MSQTEIDRVKQLNTNVELIDAQRSTIRSLLNQRIWLINMVQRLRANMSTTLIPYEPGTPATEAVQRWNAERQELLTANYPGPEYPDLEGMAIEYSVNPFIDIRRWGAVHTHVGETKEWAICHDTQGALCDQGWATGKVILFPSAESALAWICVKHPEWLTQPNKIIPPASQVAVDNL